MLKVRDGRAIKRIVEDTLKRDLDNIRVVNILVRSDVDRDGDAVLLIDVVFDGLPKDINVRNLSAAVRHIRPKLAKIGETAFPLISFISKAEAGRALRGAA
jgi:hypothetical protein